MSTFPEDAPRLAENGYAPLPIPYGRKGPVLKEWQKYVFTTTDAPRHRGKGTGLLTAHTPAADIDVRHAPTADKLQALAEQMLGVAPVRIGQAPKRALLYRCAVPFDKLSTRPFRHTDDPPGAKAHRVEFLADGQQIVAYGIHPDTQQPYRWVNGAEPLNTPAADLTEIAREQASEFIAAAEALLAAERGFEPLSESAQRIETAASEHEHGELKAKNPDECREQLAAIPNEDRDYDSFVRIMCAVKGALGDEGAEAFVEFSAKSSKHDEAWTRREFQRCRPRGIGAGTIRYLAQAEGGWRSEAERATDWPPPIDLQALAAHDPEPPRHIVPDWLPAGEVTLFAGHGGAGKSAIALQLAAHIALGREWCGMEVQRRPVLLVTCEDGEAILHWRLKRICAALGVPMEQLAEGMRVIDASDVDAELLVETRDEPVLTLRYDKLRALIDDPATVLVLDTASDLYGANEVVRRHVRRFVRALRRLVGRDGAVILLAHVDKLTAKSPDTSQGYTGSTAWSNSVRARWYLREEKDALVLALQKANNARAGAEIRMRFDATAHVHVAESTAAPAPAPVRDREDREAILAAMRACAEANITVPAATQGRRTAYHVLRAQSAFPRRLRDDKPATRRRFWELIEGLRAENALREESIRANSHRVAVLVVGGDAEAF